MTDARSRINGATDGAGKGERADISTIVPDSSFARAINRFSRHLPTQYRATTAIGAPFRATRAEAEADELAWRERER